jgi:hypothetical protein
MSGLILNCLLPFVRPPRTVSVHEAQNMSTADYLDAASDPSHSELFFFLFLSFSFNCREMIIGDRFPLFVHKH